MDATCLLYGGAISIVVSFLKRWPWAANNPKIIAFLISAVMGAWQALAHGGAATTAATVSTLVTCITTQLAAAVGTHEVLVQPVSNLMTGATIQSKG